MKQLPAKSKLSDANRKRDHKVFALIYSMLFSHYKRVLQGNWLDIGGEVDPSRVEVFDSTTVILVKNILKGAGSKPLEGNNKGGAKVVAQMKLAEGVPKSICIR